MMSDPTPIPDKTSPAAPLFNAPSPERSGFPGAAVFGAVAVVLVILGGLLLASRKTHGTPAGSILPIDPQSPNLRISDVAMSESTSLSGGKLTFIDGHIRNTGTQVVNGITVQVLFRNDVNLPPQVETLPLQLIRSREPYIDTQPVSAAPLAPGDDREFRLPFETINENWNIQIPEVRIVKVSRKN